MSGSTGHQFRRRCTEPPLPQRAAAEFDSFDVVRSAASARLRATWCANSRWPLSLTPAACRCLSARIIRI